CDRVGQKLPDIGRLPMQGERSRLSERQRPQIVDQPREHARLIEDGLEVRWVSGIHAVEERLEIALHDRERRAYLVRHIGEQATTLALAALETPGHRVEGRGQRPKLARTTRAHSDAVVAGLDVLGGVDEVTEWGREPSEPAGGGAEQQQDDDRQRYERGDPTTGGRISEDVDQDGDERRDDEAEEQESEDEHRREAAHESPAHARPLATSRRVRFTPWPPWRPPPRLRSVGRWIATRVFG